MITALFILLIIVSVPTCYAIDVQVYEVGTMIPANNLRSTSSFYIGTTTSATASRYAPYSTASSFQEEQIGSVNHEWESKTIDVYQVEVNKPYQVAGFQVNSLCPRKPFRAGGLDDEEGDGTVDEGNTEDLKPYAPIGDIPWGVILLLAGILLYIKQRKSHHTHSKSIANMKSLSRPLSILLLCLLLAPAAKADYTLTRLWRKNTGQSLAPLSQVGAINNTTAGTCGAFIVDTAGMLYIDDNSTSPQQMIRLLPNGDPHPKGNIEGCKDGYKYLWCEYDPKTNTAYWFLRNGLKNETEGFEDDMAWINYRNITQHEDSKQNDVVHGLANIYTSTAQIALSPDQYLWTASWSALNNCTIRRAKLTNPIGNHAILDSNQKTITTLFPSIDLVYIAPIDSTRALVVNRSTATYYCVLSQETQSLTPITLEEYPGLTGCHSTLGGTVFQMGGKYYYTAGRYSDEEHNYQGAFTVYKFNDSAPSDNITKTYFTHDIGPTDTPNTTTVTVTFRTVVKHDDTYGDYALIYQFVPGHGVACYYYTEEATKDEWRKVNISVTNGTASCESKPVTEANVRYFAKFQAEGETLTITWCDENGDATQTQTIVATPQQKAGYNAVFQGWKTPKDGYVTGDCEVTAEYTYEPVASAGGGCYFSRVWESSPTELRDLGTSHVLTSTDVPYGTSGSFFARHKGDDKDGLYVYATVEEDSQVKWRLLRFSEVDGHYIDSRDVLTTTDGAFRNYQWCDYYESQDRLFWFHYRGSANTSLESYQMLFTSDGGPTSCTGSAPVSNSAQARITTEAGSGIIWSVEAWNESGNDKDPVVYRTQIDHEGKYSARTDQTMGIGSAGGKTTTAVVPIDHDNALILRKGKDIISWHFNDASKATLSVNTNGVAGIFDCLGGTTFKHNGKCYYVTGCRAKNNTDYRGACAVLELAGAEVKAGERVGRVFASATVVATYKANIANRDTETSQENTSEDVTFYTVDKGDYVLIYAFSPKNGLACYYFSTKQDFDYSIRYVGNGATSGTMSDQLVRHGDKTALNQYAYTRDLTVNYHYQNSRQADTQTQVSATFKGWEDHSSITYWNDKDTTTVQTWNRSNFDAPYYCNLDRKNHAGVWEYPAYGNYSYNKTGLLQHFINHGKEEYEKGSAQRKPFADDPTVYGIYPNKDTVNNLMTEPEITDWTAAPKVVELWAQWEDKSVTLPTPDARPCYTFAGWYDAAEGGNKVGDAGEVLLVTKTQDLFARWELEADAGQVDFLDRLVTWKGTATDTTITFDLNGFYYLNGSTKVYPSNSDTRTWKINHTDVTQETTNLDPVTGQKDKTFTITRPAGVSLTGEEYVYIELYHNGVLVGGHAFPVPVIDNPPVAGRELYLHGDLTITGNQTAKNVYIEPSASLTIAADATLTITDTLYIRSRGTQVGQLLNHGNLSLGNGTLLYTHQMAQKNIAEPLAMPFPCTLPKKGDVAFVTLKTRLQAETGKASGNHVVIKKYNGAKRADGRDGTAAALWEKLSDTDITLNATEGYEIISGSAYYREYLFPLTYEKSATAATTANLTAYKTDKTAPHNIGWNFLCTPYTSNYTESIDLAPSDQKYAFIVRYAADGSFITSINMGGLDIPPFTPFYVQVNGDGTENNQKVVLTYADGAPAHLRARAQAEEAPTSWASITLSDGNAADQTTLIICNDHNDSYEVGADCEKWLTAATRPQVYTVAVDGLRAFNALPEATATRPVAVGYCAPKAAEMTFSLNEDFPLEKIEHLYLSDYETGNVTDLISNNYAFFTAAGTFNERFALSIAFRNEVSTDINGETNNFLVLPGDSTAFSTDLPRKVMKDGQLYIIVQGHVLDITGREMENFK